MKDDWSDGQWAFAGCVVVILNLVFWATVIVVAAAALKWAIGK